MREMPASTVTAAKPHRCAFCGQAISKGEAHKLFRAFDPDRSKDGGRSWGAWIQERWHLSCAMDGEGVPNA